MRDELRNDVGVCPVVECEVVQSSIGVGCNLSLMVDLGGMWDWLIGGDRRDSLGFEV